MASVLVFGQRILDEEARPGYVMAGIHWDRQRSAGFSRVILRNRASGLYLNYADEFNGQVLNQPDGSSVYPPHHLPGLSYSQLDS